MFRRKLVAVGCAVVLAVLAVSYALRRAADLPSHWPAPPRQGLNAPFIKSPDVVVDKMVELAQLRQSDLVYDLGCGDGRIVITAAMKSGCRGVGFDIDPKRVAEARDNARLHQVEPRVQIIEQDMFTVDLSKADVAMMYLLPWMVNKLVPQLQQMKPGSRIVSHEFWLDGIEPDEVVEMTHGDDNKSASIFLYRTPLRFNPALEKGKPPRPRQR